MFLSQNSRSWFTATTLLALVIGCRASKKSDIGNTNNPLSLIRYFPDWPNGTTINAHEVHTVAAGSTRWIKIHISYRSQNTTIHDTVYYYLGDPHNWEERIDRKAAARELAGYKTSKPLKRAYYESVAKAIVKEVKVPAIGQPIIWPEADAGSQQNLASFRATLESQGVPLEESYCGPFTPNEASKDSGPRRGHRHPRPSNGRNGQAEEELDPQGPEPTYLNRHQILDYVIHPNSADPTFANLHYGHNLTAAEHWSFYGYIMALDADANFLGTDQFPDKTNQSLSEEDQFLPGQLTFEAGQRLIQIWRLYLQIKEVRDLVDHHVECPHMQQVSGITTDQLQDVRNNAKEIFQRFKAQLWTMGLDPKEPWQGREAAWEAIWHGWQASPHLRAALTFADANDARACGWTPALV